MKKHANIPIFVPHIGCPNDCVFCNQRTISGKSEFCVESVEEEIENALKMLDGFEGEKQIAFFGGSFTGIERPLMIRLLEISKCYIDKGAVASVRLSTRPDYIDSEILSILSFYGVSNIELGIQSMNDEVLLKNRRGHTSDDSRRAMSLIVEKGFSLTGQMMTGMYGASANDEIFTSEEIVKYGAESARIYPTVTFKDTLLERFFSEGLYLPLTLDETIERGASVYRIFEKNRVKVIRIGLQSTEGLHSDKVVAGEYRDAIGEMILSRVRFFEMLEVLEKSDDDTFFAPKNLLSQYLGQKKENLIRLKNKLGREIKIKTK